ncbi:MAG: nucleotide sugar dehydrogenase [Pseudomonadota bacterium]|nr:nucleotide sugar dehydrogenase [Gammaproteobacteria bacterium]MBU1558884.1 nucleotide sugar dehydrogenase [Gammaproteobacteria bacterium]MBU1926428.1 nucleotide sugar dehydrogenase [Gammaproteobacteria bacterium]MBU2545590.1 nucleotide sugar dehydrogenase [Gammaproteobacteria bacterium]
MNATIAVIGLGYVGLPLATAFGRQFKTIGFDISKSRVEALKKGRDVTYEIEPKALTKAKLLEFTEDAARLKEADFIIVAVPTPVNVAHQPDFEPLIAASRLAGAHLKPGAIIVYESTVYPGATEEVCVPVLEQASEKRWKQDFFVAYSPERVNPSDRKHTLTNIVKVVSGDCKNTLNKVTELYETIIEAGVHRVSNIKAAEAAKVIENTQRDLNIALMNELSVIFHRQGIDTLEVLEAAGTKWNFLPFRPGLVGGHCIGVDPYYLTYKAEMLGYHPQVILAGRRINDGMGEYIASETVKKMLSLGIAVSKARVNVLGLTFKENCPDLRNSKVVDVVKGLKKYFVNVSVHDPIADLELAKNEYDIDLVAWDDLPKCDALIIAVAHKELVEKSLDAYLKKMKQPACLIDVKSIFDIADLEAKNIPYWRL